MSAPLLYLYGLVRAGIDTAAIDGIEEGSAIAVIDADGIGCAATPVPAEGYERRIDGSNADDLAWLTPRVWRHHQALRALQQRDAVVPFKFGTVCSSAEATRAMVARLHGTATDLLPRLAGKDEWTLRIAAHPPVGPAAVPDVHPMPVGAAYFARKRQQQADAARVEALLTDIEAAVSGRLAALGAEVAFIPRLRRGDRRERVAETAVLLRSDEFRSVEASLQELEAEYASSVSFELVGPWPPYSFASIDQAMPPEYDSHSPL